MSIFSDDFIICKIYNRKLNIHRIHNEFMLDGNLFWELSVLSRCVNYTNLSMASRHVGLSQPQLSRIVQKIEESLSLKLLDRSTKRKSSWLPMAHRLAEAFQKGAKQLSLEVESLSHQNQVKHVRIGFLEGLSDLSIPLAKKIFKADIPVCELDLHDLSNLEDLFLKGYYDIIFTSREPSNRKMKYYKMLGYQTLEQIKKDKKTHVLSSFEYNSRQGRSKKLEATNTLISNSLYLRQMWLRKQGGYGVLPSSIHSKAHKTSLDTPVWIFGSETLHPTLWALIK